MAWRHCIWKLFIECFFWHIIVCVVGVCVCRSNCVNNPNSTLTIIIVDAVIGFVGFIVVVMMIAVGLFSVDFR